MPMRRGSTVCCTTPTRMNQTFAPATAMPPLPALRASSSPALADDGGTGSGATAGFVTGASLFRTCRHAASTSRLLASPRPWVRQETTLHVIAHQTASLHECVADRRADETKPARAKILAHRV